jgi:phospholipid/cholesterol/gamma-HCH transport system substrate-binding protein
MKQNILETIIGLIVLIISGWFFIFAYNVNRMNTDNDVYTVEAKFQNAEGIVPGSDIMVAGIKIGEVSKMILDRETFFAVMQLEINDAIKIPKDSQASVSSSGFLGSKFISIVPGVSSEDLVDKDIIKFTQSSVNLESLIGKFMYSFGNK